MSTAAENAPYRKIAVLDFSQRRALNFHPCPMDILGIDACLAETT
jgi:hypothetical protein